MIAVAAAPPQVDTDRTGTTVLIDGDPATIAGHRDGFLMVLFEDAVLPVPVHPTWRVEYPQAVAS